jgi:REP element-mobilizing transposase RayT
MVVAYTEIMPRTARVEAAGVIHHVTGRSAGELQVFQEARDCRRFLGLLEQSTAECGWVVYAYCLMPNHVHLLLQTPEPNLGLGMRPVMGRFAQELNRRRSRHGAIWGERFHSRLVASERHALRSAAYIVLNPVRARLVRTAAEWPWSSFRATAGMEPAPAFLAVDAILSWISPDPEAARTMYTDWINAEAERLVEQWGESPTGTVPCLEPPWEQERRGGQSPVGTVPTPVPRPAT